MLETKEVLKATVDTITSDDIVVRQWKRVPIECKGQKKMVMKIVDMHMTKEEFVTHVTTQVEEFSEHVSRIRIQCQEMKRLKDSLPPNHCIVHIDFSEN